MNGYKQFIEDQFEIVDKTSSIIPFRLNPVQAKYLLEDYSGRDVVLKARQQGFSSLILALFTTDFILKPNTRSVIVADISDNAMDLLDRVKFFLKSYEHHNQVKIPLKYNSKYELYNEANGSRYTIGTADNSEFGRSKTINNLHLSEFAFYKQPEKLFAGAMQAVVPDGRVIIETTANGFNFFREFWYECVQDKRNFKANFYKASDFYTPDVLSQKRSELGRFFRQEYPDSPEEAFIKATGLVYDTFDSSVHIADLPDFKPVFYLRGLDIGFRNPAAMPFIAVDKDDVWYQIGEIYEPELTTPLLAQKIQEIVKNLGIAEFEYSTADSAQIGDIMELNTNHNMDFVPVKKQSGEGKIDYVRWKVQKFTERLAMKDGRSGYYVHPSCENTIREFISYRWKAKPNTQATDINEPEAPEKANDHMMDALGDLNAMYLHFYEPREKKPWEGKLPGTYVPPAILEEEQETGFTSERPDNYWEQEI